MKEPSTAHMQSFATSLLINSGTIQARTLMEPLRLVYGDRKTVSLIQVVKKEQAEPTLPYEICNSLLPIPGLFHWRTNYMDMIHELYSGTEAAADEMDLDDHRSYLHF